MRVDVVVLGLFAIVTAAHAAKIPPSSKHAMDHTKQAFLTALAKPESHGDYTIKNGNSHFTSFAAFPEGVGTDGKSTASGKYQIISGTWKMLAPLIGATDFSPTNQDRAAWYYAATTYHLCTHRDLESDLRRGDHRREIASALKDVWPTIKPDNLPGSAFDRYGRLLPTSVFSRDGRLLPTSTTDRFGYVLPTSPFDPLHTMRFHHKRQ